MSREEEWTKFRDANPGLNTPAARAAFKAGWLAGWKARGNNA